VSECSTRRVSRRFQASWRGPCREGLKLLCTRSRGGDPGTIFGDPGDEAVSWHGADGASAVTVAGKITIITVQGPAGVCKTALKVGNAMHIDPKVRTEKSQVSASLLRPIASADDALVH